MNEENNQYLSVNENQVNTNKNQDITQFAKDLINGKDDGKTTNADLNSENSTHPDNLLQQASRVTAHSLYGGLVRPTLGLANLGTELANGAWHALGGKSNLNYYTNEALNKADELDKDLDRGKEDWASSDGLASELGSWASLLIPIGGELKLADKVGDVGKRLLDRDTYDKEQAIKNSFDTIKNAIPTKTEQGLMINKELNNEVSNLNKLYQEHDDIKFDYDNDNALNDVLDRIKKSKEKIQSLIQKASTTADDQQKINDVVKEELNNIEKQKSTLSPNLASNIIDYGITGKKGYALIPSALMGAAYGAGESSNKDSLTQVENAIDGAVLGCVSTGVLHYLANGGTNFTSYFKMPQNTEVPTLNDAQKDNIDKMVNMTPSHSEGKISELSRDKGDNILPDVQYLIDMQKYGKLPPPPSKEFGKMNEEDLKTYNNQESKKIVTNMNVQNKGLPDRPYGARDNTKLTTSQLEPPKTIWQRLTALSRGYVKDPAEDSYIGQWASFMPAVMRHLQYPNLSFNKASIDFLNKRLEKAYDYAIDNDYHIPFADQSNAFLDYINKNISSIKAKNNELQPLIDLGIKSTKAYRNLEDSVKLLNEIAPNDKELESLDLKNHIKKMDIRQSVKSRILEEIEKTGDNATAISNLRKNLALYKTSSADQLENKIRAHQNELNTQTSKDLNGGDISVYNMRQYKDKIKDIGEDKKTSDTRDIYQELGKHILPHFTKHQDKIYINFLKKEGDEAVKAFSSGKDGNGKLQSVTKILRQLHDNEDSAEAVHQLLKAGEYGDTMDVSSLTQSAINKNASMADKGVDAFIDRLNELVNQQNKNAIALKEQYGGNLENLRENFKNLSRYANKKVGTQNSNNNTISDESRSALIGAAKNIWQYRKEQKENDRRIQNQLDYMAFQQLFGGLNRSRNPIAGFKHGVIHGLKHLWAVAGIHNGKLEEYMDGNVRNMLSPNPDSVDNNAIIQSRSQLASFHNNKDVNQEFEGKKGVENIKGINEDTLVPIHNKERDTTVLVPIKNIKDVSQFNESVAAIQKMAEDIATNQKNVRSRVNDMQRTTNDNLQKNYEMMGRLHYLLPRNFLSVPTVTGSFYPAYYNFLQSRYGAQTNNENNNK